jgi:predicted nucleic acid-binding protein
MPQVAPVLVDSNVILDVATNDPLWGAWSSEALASEIERTQLVINPLIYAEVSIGYARIEELEAALPSGLYRREPLPYEAGFLAGKVFLRYRRRRGARQTPLPDLYIGAHAAVAGYRLLTRDAKRFRSYFPTVQLVAPN